MGSIINRGGRWRAQVRRQGFRPQCKTFATKAQAERWVRELEGDIEAGTADTLGDLTVGQVLQAYRKLRTIARKAERAFFCILRRQGKLPFLRTIARKAERAFFCILRRQGKLPFLRTIARKAERDASTEHYTLNALERGLGSLVLSRVLPTDLVGYATRRRDEGAGPYTVNMDVSKLGTALRYGCAALRVTPPDVVGAARPLLTHLRLIGGGGKRERRPTEDEFHRIVALLREQRGVIYADAVEFAACSAMRRGEVVALKWADVDAATHCAVVMRKHPRLGKKAETVPILPRAWAVMQRQPRAGERVFPLHESTLSKYFTWACRDLSIPDLHFHDLRHDGTSAMFEAGMTMQEVAMVTGHKSWSNLQRYTNLRPEDLTRRAHAPDPDTRPRPARRRTEPSLRGTSSPGKTRR